MSLPLTDYDATRDSKTCAVNLGFRWGEAFHHMNPSEFYDQTGIASSYPDEGEKSYRNDLNKFYKTMTGVESGSTQTPLEMNFCVKLVASTSGTRS